MSEEEQLALALQMSLQGPMETESTEVGYLASQRLMGELTHTALSLAHSKNGDDLHNICINYTYTYPYTYAHMHSLQPPRRKPHKNQNPLVVMEGERRRKEGMRVRWKI